MSPVRRCSPGPRPRAPRFGSPRRAAAFALAAAALALASCSHSHTAQRVLSERERDSLIARSSLPGAPVVGRALALSDSMATRADRQSQWTPPADENTAGAVPGENP